MTTPRRREYRTRSALNITRLICRQMAREEFAKRMAEAATDNSQDSTINHDGGTT
jgi:hypothetical protein